MKYFLAIIFLVFLFSCYTQKKAERDVNKVGVAFPSILAKKARDMFPCIIIGSDTIYTTDSAMYQEVLNELQNQYYEMYLEKDSLRKELAKIEADTMCYEIIEMYRTIIDQRDKKIELLLHKVTHIPPIIKTITIHDTTVDNGAVKACEFDKSKVIALLESETAEKKSWRSKAKNRFWTILIMGAIIGIWGYLEVSRLFKPKIKL